MNGQTGNFYYFKTFNSQTIIEILTTRNYQTMFDIKNFHVFVFFQCSKK